MQRLDILADTKISSSGRAKQISAIFDVPLSKRSEFSLSCDIDMPEKWNVGLIVGQSGGGKSLSLTKLFGVEKKLSFSGDSVIDDFPDDLSIDDVSAICQSVGFNTIPSWLRPYKVLSNGEKFRVELAMRLALAKKDEPIIVDEFTSVVDRQVAQIASYAMQKYVRKNEMQFVAATCHYDVIEWLMPDWVLDVSKKTFTSGRWLWQRPKIKCEIRKVDRREYWPIFSPYHYLTSKLNSSAQCFCLFVNDVPACFSGIIHFPHAQRKNIKRVSRTVTLPDYQGLGLVFILNEFLGAAYKSLGFELRKYPNHPSYVRSLMQSKNWELAFKGFCTGETKKTTLSSVRSTKGGYTHTFKYIGPSIPESLARKILTASK